GACEFCQALNGKIVGLSSSFANVGENVEGALGGVYIVDYMDITHPPLHPNCKCSILPVSGAELAKARLTEMVKEYEEMDKRTREAKELLEEIRSEKEKLMAEREEF